MKAFQLSVIAMSVVVLTACKREVIAPGPALVRQIVATSQDSILAQSTGTNQLAPIKLPAAITTPQAMIAKWNLVTDSSSWCYGPDPVVHTKSYDGAPSDYFDFRADGKCYTKEGSVYDTLAYTVTVGNQIILQKFGANVNGYYLADDITEFTAHNFNIATPFFATPMGWSTRGLYLTK
jgi:hypothetical protein